MVKSLNSGPIQLNVHYLVQTVCDQQGATEYKRHAGTGTHTHTHTHTQMEMLTESLECVQESAMRNKPTEVM